LKPFLNLPIEEALALFDKRVGERRLQLMATQIHNEPLLVQHFYALRCQAEQL